MDRKVPARIYSCRKCAPDKAQSRKRADTFSIRFKSVSSPLHLYRAGNSFVRRIYTRSLNSIQSTEFESKPHIWPPSPPLASRRIQPVSAKLWPDMASVSNVKPIHKCADNGFYVSVCMWFPERMCYDTDEVLTSKRKRRRDAGVDPGSCANGFCMRRAHHRFWGKWEESEGERTGKMCIPIALRRWRQIYIKYTSFVWSSMHITMCNVKRTLALDCRRAAAGGLCG